MFVADSNKDLFVSCCDEASHQATFCDTLRLAAGLFLFLLLAIVQIILKPTTWVFCNPPWFLNLHLKLISALGLRVKSAFFKIAIWSCFTKCLCVHQCVCVETSLCSCISIVYVWHVLYSKLFIQLLCRCWRVHVIRGEEAVIVEWLMWK